MHDERRRHQPRPARLLPRRLNSRSAQAARVSPARRGDARATVCARAAVTVADAVSRSATDPRMSLLRASFLPLAIAALLPPGAAGAAERCDADRLHASPPALNFRVDNDLLGSGGQDQGYTNGVLVTLVSPDLKDYTRDPCLPRLARWLNERIDGDRSRPADQKNMVFGIGQALYTPKDWTRRDVVADDRPYAAIVMARFGYNFRRGDALHTTQLQVGVVGPLALGKEVQDAVHDALGVDRFAGWHRQLRNEPLVGLLHERMRKRPAAPLGPAGLQWDAIGHGGGVLGNAFSHANAGAEIRLGWHLPDDFGSTPLRPAGENTAPGGASRSRRLFGHVFLTGDARWVLRDITLDGNTFASGHRVDRKPLVGEIGYGLVVSRGRWKFALARYYRSREFDTQEAAPKFGSFTVSRML